MSSSSVKHLSNCLIRPHHSSEESKQPIYLAPIDLAVLSGHYIQKGLLFAKPPQAMDDHHAYITTLLDKLKHSFSLALVHFYPLAGRLAMKKEENPALYVIYVDCSNCPGAKFIHATLDMPISDILSPTDVPLVVQSFFDHDRAVNHDGHVMSLVTVQVTELVDGVFIGLSMNHCLADGTSYWHFFNTWSEIFQAQTQTHGGNNDNIMPKISRPPVLQRWISDSHGPIINLPFKHPDEFIDRYVAPPLPESIFHFSSESIAKLKAKANAESNTTKISSFQSLSALLWRSVARAHSLPPSQTTSCRLAANYRARLDPSLSGYYFGNAIYPISAEVVTSGELLEHGIGWPAWKLHEAVVNLDNQSLRGFVEAWLHSPTVYQTGQSFDPYGVMISSSPRFNMYGNEFGMGKPVALRSGYANKFSGKVSAYPGRETGSVDLEVRLPPDAMSALECDNEFMQSASLPQY